MKPKTSKAGLPVIFIHRPEWYKPYTVYENSAVYPAPPEKVRLRHFEDRTEAELDFASR